MEQRKIEIFIRSLGHFLRQHGIDQINVGAPYLASNQQPTAFDYTGLIGISGAYRGCVYFSAPTAMLKHMLLAMGEADLGSQNLADLVGEVANTLSGNARAEVGSDFMISVPMVVEGAPDRIHLPQELRSYVVPVHWKAYRAAIVVCLSQ